ncbi:hypothetical protein HMPREF3039_03321 [Akkermansia sp. KLE1798]|jgi:hypothetical protein|nr:hypothetical protein HMPREF3039_03321 [Akkermansia sp. KLE1798]KZA03300.1 hypothetical protein HMPREF1326_03019 [Akkermansia sp. KLE1605]
MRKKHVFYSNSPVRNIFCGVFRICFSATACGRHSVFPEIRDAMEKNLFEGSLPEDGSF